MAKGRKPKPTALKLIDGNPGKRPIRKNEPKSFLAAKAPAWISRKAKVEWNKYGPELERMGLLTLVDVPAFAAFCTAIAEFRWCEEHIKEHGRLVMTPNGYHQTSPVISQRRQALDQIRQFGSEFGLTPSARSKIIVADDKIPTIGNTFGAPVSIDGG